MNIFALSTEEAVKEIQKVLDSIPREQMIEELKECGFKVREVRRMKLIDVLNMIAKGELEEGTKIKWGDDIYEDVESLWGDMYFESLNEEVEIIGKDTNVPTKIEWISVNDRLPQHNEQVLICLSNTFVSTGYYQDDCWLILECKNKWEVTHWAELPELPKEVETNDI